MSTILDESCVICLTGLTIEKKEYLHNIIKELGGIYTRDFNIYKNTHLISSNVDETPNSKYQTALSFNSNTKNKKKQRTIHIVKPEWLEECLHKQIHIDEKEYYLVLEEEIEITPFLLLNEINKQLFINENEEKQNKRHMLFSSCCFLLLGFDNDDDDDDDDSNDEEEEDMTNRRMIKNNLSKLIRRGMGTIYYELNASITHIIVNEFYCNSSTTSTTSKEEDSTTIDIIKIANKISNHHPNGLICISPQYIIDSYKHNTLLNFTNRYMPKHRKYQQHQHPSIVKKRKSVNDSSRENKTRQQKQITKKAATNSKKRKQPSNTEAAVTKTSNLFHGSLFTIVKLQSQNDDGDEDTNIVTYCTNELEKQIKNNGGYMLSNEWIHELRKEKEKQGTTRSRARKTGDVSNNNNNIPDVNCYVLHWGTSYGSHQSEYTPSHITIHPLLGQIKKHSLANIILVTPIWLQTCIQEQEQININNNSNNDNNINILFTPQSWPIRRYNKFVSSSASDKNNDNNIIKISITGFVGHVRTGIINLLSCIGLHYTEDMKNNITTHLIVNTSDKKYTKGIKYKKAIEWNNIHVVSIDWLYYIAQYGYNNTDNNKNIKISSSTISSEEKFSLLSSSSKTK